MGEGGRDGEEVNSPTCLEIGRMARRDDKQVEGWAGRIGVTPDSRETT